MNIDRRTVLKSIAGAAVAGATSMLGLDYATGGKVTRSIGFYGAMPVSIYNDSDTGFYRSATNELRFVVRGRRVAGFPIMDASRYLRDDI